ncbi:MAG: hypothetical protein COB78_03340 [Hyphomicrobiales bacterium]|nr:MAG: hypothetical protein COB78_03340 [Hyphomicrobiales bacterium]
MMIKLWRHAGIIALLLILALNLGPVSASAQIQQTEPNTSQKTARIGVLAFRGVDASRTHWQPLADYLTHSISDWKFELVPMNLVSAPRQIEDKLIDFVVTNPGHFVDLAERFGLSALATREKLDANTNRQLQEFGIAIVVRNDSDIHAIADLKGRSIAAVSRDAFGGFQIAWHELEAQGIDIFTDMSSVRYMGFPMDALMSAVLNSKVDAGIIRTGLLETLVNEGRLKLSDIRVLNSNLHLDYPHKISSRLYPEWPFAVLPGIPKKLRESVLRHLLNTQDRTISKRHGLTDIWSTPLYYGDVQKLVRSYRDRLTKENFAWKISTPQIAMLSGLLMLLTFLGWKMGWIKGRQSKGISSEQSGTIRSNDPEGELILQKFETLTSRERQVLHLVCNGLSTKGIAHELGISPKTVEFHRTNLLQKTEAGTTAHLVQLATRLNYDQGYPLGQTS